MLFENIPPLPRLQLPLFYGAFNQEAKSCGLLGSSRFMLNGQSQQHSGWRQWAEDIAPSQKHRALTHIAELQSRAFPNPAALQKFCDSGVPLHLPEYFGSDARGYISQTEDTIMFCRLTPGHYDCDVEVLCYDSSTLRQHLEQLEAMLQQSQTVRFYYPLSAEYFPLLDAEFGFNERTEHPEEMDAIDLAAHQAEIQQAIQKQEMPEESVRGLIAFYDNDDTLWQKIASATPAVEVINGKLWGIAECQVVGELASNEIACFKDYWSGQMSDGWGEGFEQRGIHSGLQHIGELYVQFWQGRNWEMMTEEEFEQYQQQGQQML